MFGGEPMLINKNAKLEDLYEDEENKIIFMKLKQDYLSETSSIIPFIGAGMSYPIFPTWKAFFEETLNTKRVKKSDKEEVNILLKQDKYEEAASKLELALGKGAYLDVIKDSFHTDKISKEKLDHMAVRFIPSVFKNNVVITTNFDHVLEKAYRNYGTEFSTVFTYCERSKVIAGEAVQGREHHLYKIHGDYSASDKIIFTKEQYDECYGTDFDSEYIEVLTELLQSKILLFLGCSLHSDRTMELLKKIAVKKKRIHYALISQYDNETEDELFDRIKRLSDIGIRCIWYPAGKHEYVSIFLQELLKLSMIKNKEFLPKIETSTLVRRPSKFFLGRKQEIACIQRILKSNSKIVLVNGIGGIGKSQICTSMYYRYADEGSRDFKYIAWITYFNSLKYSFFNKFKRVDETQDVEEYFEKCIQYLNDLGQQLLLFIDNANTMNANEQKIVASLHCSVVLTSRLVHMNDSIITVPIDRLEEQDCVMLYRKHFEEGLDTSKIDPSILELEYIKKIIAKSVRHTITVVLLAKVQRASHMTSKELYDKLDAMGFTLEGLFETINFENEDNILIEQLAKVFSLADLDKEEIRLLGQFSLLPYEVIQGRYLKEWFRLKSYNKPNKLVNKGWINEDGLTGFIMHPVISDVVRYEYKPCFDDCSVLVDFLINALEVGDYDNFIEKLQWLPFGNSICEKLEIGNIEIAKLAVNTADMFSNQGMYEKSVCLYINALKVFKEIADKEGEVIAYNNLALVFDLQGRYDEALENYQNALTISKKLYGINSEETAHIYNNLGLVYDDKCNLEKAEKYYKLAIRIYQRVEGEVNIKVADSMNNLAAVYMEKNNYKKATELYEKTMDIWCKKLGEKHPQTIIAYNNIVALQVEMNNYEAALKIFDKVIPIAEEILGEQHPDTLSFYNNLAILYQKTGKIDEAIKIEQKCYEDYYNLFGISHPDTIKSMDNLAQLFKEKGDYERALKLHQKALYQIVDVLGHTHSVTADIYHNLAALYSEKGEYDVALKNYHEALSIRSYIFGEASGQVADINDDMARVYMKLGNYTEALRLEKKALKIYKSLYGDEHPNVGDAYLGIGSVYLDRSDFKKALFYYNKTLAIRQKIFGENHLSTAISYRGIADVYVDQGRFQEAYAYYNKALKIQIEILGEEHLTVAGTYNNIGYLYEQKDDFDMALKYMKKAIAIEESILGSENLVTAVGYSNISNIYATLGEYKQSEYYCSRALNIRLSVLGEESMDTVTSYNSLGLLYADMGNPDEAVFLCEKALHICLKLEGENHIKTANCYNSLGYVYDEMEKYRKAEEMYKHSLAIKGKLLGSTHKQTLSTMNNLATVYLAEGEYDEAKILLEDIINSLKQLEDTMSADVAVMYNNLASAYDSLEIYDKSLLFYEKALKINKHIYGEFHKDIAICYNNLAAVYVNLDDIKKGLVFLLKSEEVCKHCIEYEHPLYVRIRKSIQDIQDVLNEE